MLQVNGQAVASPTFKIKPQTGHRPPTNIDLQPNSKAMLLVLLLLIRSLLFCCPSRFSVLGARRPAAAGVRRFPSRLLFPWLLAALLDRLLLAFFSLTLAHLLSPALLLLLNPYLLSIFVQLVERIPGSIFVLPSFVIQCRKLLGAIATNFWASSYW
ncbi:hypothetical protein Cgig2_003816 [Carnegiea gigantea]|uniref:Uncharacterized protein n=1 Tax=Carnegiea gigantea TaxID=171969 RepID=A0A9Q1JFI7_9CARY|nr:hypothetical protein Cgig2_003816 [Carnegiea gigantea]